MKKVHHTKFSVKVLAQLMEVLWETSLAGSVQPIVYKADINNSPNEEAIVVTMYCIDICGHFEQHCNYGPDSSLFLHSWDPRQLLRQFRSSWRWGKVVTHNTTRGMWCFPTGYNIPGLQHIWSDLPPISHTLTVSLGGISYHRTPAPQHNIIIIARINIKSQTTNTKI